jgi:hypothetical protein
MSQKISGLLSYLFVGGTATRYTEKEMSIELHTADWMGMKKQVQHANTMNRARSSSALTARSSASRMARANPFSSNARTPAASHGPSSAVGSGERVSRRYGDEHTNIRPVQRLTDITGASQDPPSPSSEVSACGRWCFPRCDQGAPLDAPRGSLCRSLAGHQGGQGEARSSTERKEGREG